MRVIAVPTRSYPPDPAELARADVVADAMAALTAATIDPVRIEGAGDSRLTALE